MSLRTKLHSLNTWFFRFIRNLQYFYRPSSQRFCTVHISDPQATTFTEVGCLLIDFLLASEVIEIYDNPWDRIIVSQSVKQSVSQSAGQSIRNLAASWPVSQSVCLSVSLSVCLCVCLSVSHSGSQSNRLSVCSSVCLSVIHSGSQSVSFCLLGR